MLNGYEMSDNSFDRSGNSSLYICKNESLIRFFTFGQVKRLDGKLKTNK